MWIEQLNNIRLFNNGKYNKDNLIRYKFQYERGLEAVFIPQNKGIWEKGVPHQKEYFDPTSVGVDKHYFPDDQKIHIDCAPFSPYDLQDSDKPVPITDAPLISTSVTFLKGYLP